MYSDHENQNISRETELLPGKLALDFKTAKKNFDC